MSWNNFKDVEQRKPFELGLTVGFLDANAYLFIMTPVEELSAAFGVRPKYLRKIIRALRHRNGITQQKLTLYSGINYRAMLKYGIAGVNAVAGTTYLAVPRYLKRWDKYNEEINTINKLARKNRQGS